MLTSLIMLDLKSSILLLLSCHFLLFGIINAKQCLRNSDCPYGTRTACRGNKDGGLGTCMDWSICENGKRCKQGSEKCLDYPGFDEYVFSSYSNRLCTFIMV